MVQLNGESGDESWHNATTHFGINQSVIALKILYPIDNPIDKLVDKPSLWGVKAPLLLLWLSLLWLLLSLLCIIYYISFVQFFLITTILTIMIFIHYFHFLKVIYKLTGVIHPIGLGAGQSLNRFQDVPEDNPGLMKFHSLFPLQ